MAGNISAAGAYTNAIIQTKTAGVRTAREEKKPVWNPDKTYAYLEDMNQGFLDYGTQATSYYSSVISGQGGDGTLTVDELKKEIQELFPEYTLTDTEPGKVKEGTFYLYIDNSQLKKLANDPAYRAKVYGLMDRELQGKHGYTLQYSDGRNVKSHLTGSIFSLSESNRQYAGAEGIPYRGSCTSDHSVSTSTSHPQVRSMDFLNDHLDPAKSAANDRKANAARLAAKRLKKKKEQERAEKQRERREAALELIYDTMQSQSAGAKYRSAEDIEMDAVLRTGTEAEETGQEFKNLDEWVRYLQGKYSTFGQGIVSISGSYLRECFRDAQKRTGLEELLQSAEDMYQYAKENNEGFQGMRIKIDKDGNMESESWGGKVAVNEGKRLRQIAAAKNPAQLRMVMGLLNGDLSDCENGLRMGMCDENEVAKVKALIQKAQQRLAELSGSDTSSEEDTMAMDTFSINMLM